MYLALIEKRKDHLFEQNTRYLFVEAAGRFLQRLEAVSEPLEPELLLPHLKWLNLTATPMPTAIQDLLEGQVEIAQSLGTMTAQLHQALSSCEHHPDFSPIPFTLFHQRSIYQTMRRKSLEAFTCLRKLKQVEDIEKLQGIFLKKIQNIPHDLWTGQRIRYHGNFILENLMHSGNDFFATHFGGRALLSEAERKYKRSPLRDVASMLYSITEVAFEAAEKMHTQGLITDIHQAHQSALGWSMWVGTTFLRAYLKEVKSLPCIPHSSQEIDLMMTIFLCECCFDVITSQKAHALDPAYNLLTRLLT